MTRIISALLLALVACFATAREATPIQLADNAPERHIVVPGDTLWGISSKFLKEPWRWPEVWRMNRDQIKNPHRIYPGDVIVLERDTSGPRLVRLSPKSYSEELKKEIPAIPASAIEPFISQPLIIDNKSLEGAARFVAFEQDRVFAGAGETAYVIGASDEEEQEMWQIFRPAKPMLDPETKQPLGFEAFFLGTARQIEPGEPGVFKILTAKQEVGRGDWLSPAPPTKVIDYIPRNPDVDVEGRVASVYGGVGVGGTHSVVALNRGASDGIELGHVLALYRNRVETFRNVANGKKEKVTLPKTRYGLVFVFRTFERVSYGLVLNATGSVLVNDFVQTP